MKKLLVIAFVFVGLITTAQVKIGNNVTTINANSLLELESANKGLLMPRVVLTNINTPGPLTAHVAGMTVYNTAAAVAGVSGDAKGLYQNDGTKWVQVIKTIPPVPTQASLTGQTSGIVVNQGSSGTTETWLGFEAGRNSSDDRTTIIGNEAGKDGNHGRSTIVGYQAGMNATDANTNVLIGLSAGSGATSMQSSTILGTNAGTNAIDVVESIFIGQGTGTAAARASKSIFIGFNSGVSDTVNNNTGNAADTSILIGNNTSTGGFSNSVAIGNGATNFRENQFLIDAPLSAAGRFDDFNVRAGSSAFSGVVNVAQGLYVGTDVQFNGIGTNTVDTNILTKSPVGNITTRSLSSLMGDAKSSGRRVTAATTALATDNTILCDATTAAYTLTIPAAAAGNDGKIYTIRKTDQTANVLTLSQTVKITETTSFTTLNYSKTIRIQSIAGSWWLID